MRLIPSRIHGFLDYATALLLIAAPWLFNFAGNGAETWVPVVLGIGVVAYSLITAYEWGVSPLLSMRTHLIIDALGGALLALSPWLFGFADRVWAPHLFVGLFELAAAALTRPVADRGPALGRTTSTSAR